MRKYFTLLLTIALFNVAKAQMSVSPTKYDYSQLSAGITENCTTKLQQAEAIYKWLCRNIAYDTDKVIRDADTCFDRKKGVCQAYCELFYRLAEPLNLSTIIVSGKTKNDDGSIPEIGHAWLIVDIGEYHIFIDPTWGAGYCDDDNVFHFNENDMSWFNVNPYWMIFTHFPDDTNYQMLETPIDLETFKRLPNDIKPKYGILGLSAKSIFTSAVNGSLSLPEIFMGNNKGIAAFNIPLAPVLRIGQKYDFTIRKASNFDVVLINGGRSVKDHEWAHQNDLCGVQFMPTREDEVILAIDGDGEFYPIIKYKVAPPTNQDWANVEPYYPFEMPELKNISGFDGDLLKKLGINGANFLQQYRNGAIGECLPKFYHQHDYIQLANVPLTGKLKIGQFYDFVVKKTGNRSVMIYSNGEPVKESQWQNLGEYIGVKYMPKSTENVVLALELENGTQFTTVAEYSIETPTTHDWDNLAQYYPYYLPELKNIGGFNPELLEQIGIDGHSFLRMFRSGKVGRELPVIYSQAKQMRVVDVPMAKRLKVGQSYLFSLKPIAGSDWYISNGDNLSRVDFHNWAINPTTGTLSMTVTPLKRGSLNLVVGNGSGSQYYIALEYIVE